MWPSFNVKRGAVGITSQTFPSVQKLPVPQKITLWGKGSVSFANVWGSETFQPPPDVKGGLERC
ncbi:hypothetical protein predicted by Glimmer/Critica [Acetobacter senegalensis]|uniref:Uncharacterized protein n=1 Tax=Acetobacter senegalensis TaxID=446692 RepID=A0A0U5EQ93_9PROT|nr:hypothetical protein predicted by Glimmer/Critica [Acetobacter senegalensis]